MTWAARFKPSVLWGRIAFGSILLCSAAALAEEALWKMYVETGKEAYQYGRYATAETMLLAARKEAEGFGSNDVRLASTLFWLARVYDTDKKDEKAELNYRRAIEIWGTASAPASIDEFADALNNLAGKLRDQKKYDEAELLYKRAQDMAEKHFGPDDPHVAAALSTQADNFYNQEKYAEAEPLYVRALAITETKQGSEDPAIVDSMRPLVLTLFAQKKVSQARLLTERAIAILEKNNQPEDLAAPLTFLNNLAGKLRDQKNYDQAELLYKRAQDMAEKHFGPDDPHVAAALSTQADKLYDEEKYAEAEPLYVRALAITEKKKGSEDRDVVDSIKPLALTLFAQKKVSQARLLTERAIAILEKNNQPEDLAAPLTFLNNLAGKLRNQKKYGEAEPVYKHAQDMAEKHFGPDDPHVAAALSTQADNFYNQEKYAEAEPLYVRALAITEKKQGSKNPDVVTSIRPLAMTLFAQKKFNQARLLAERAIAILKKNNQPEDLAAPLTFLGRTCEGLRRYADAERAYKQVLDTLGPDNSAALDTLENYSRMLRDLKREPEAETLEARIRKIRATTSTRRDN